MVRSAARRRALKPRAGCPGFATGVVFYTGAWVIPFGDTSWAVRMGGLKGRESGVEPPTLQSLPGYAMPGSIILHPNNMGCFLLRWLDTAFSGRSATEFSWLSAYGALPWAPRTVPSALRMASPIVPPGTSRRGGGMPR